MFASLESLEPRHLLILPTPIAGNVATFTDIDGDEVTVRLAGPGDLARIGVPGDANFALFATSTSLASTLSISIKKGNAGNGGTFARGVQAGELGSLLAPGLDVGQDGLVFSGHVNTITVKSVGSGDTTIGGGVGLPVTFTALDGIFGDGTSQPGQHVISALGKVLSIKTKFLSARIDAGAIKSLSFFNNPTNNVAILNSRFNLTGAAGFTQVVPAITTSKQVINFSISATGDVGALKFGPTDDLHLNVVGHVKSLQITGDADEVSIESQTMGPISVSRRLDSALFASFAATPGSVGIGALKFGEILDAEFTTNGTRIASFTAGSMDGVSFDIGSIGALTVNGSAALGLRGDADFSLIARDTSRPLSVDKITVKGVIFGSVVVRGNAGLITLGGIGEGWVALVGTTNPDPDVFRNAGTPFDDAGLFAGTGGTLAGLKVARPPLNGAFDRFNLNIERYAVVARAIGKIEMFTGFASDASGGFNNHWGIATQSVASFKRTGLNSSASGANLTGNALEALLFVTPGFLGLAFATCADTTLADPEANAGFAMLTLFK